MLLISDFSIGWEYEWVSGNFKSDTKKIPLSILTNKKVLFIKKAEPFGRIVIVTTNRWPLDGAILEWRFWITHII